MTRFRNILRPVILSTLMVMAAAIGGAQAQVGTCDTYCPFGGPATFDTCWEGEFAIWCVYTDGHDYTSFGGNC
ncbi:hypothetical protein [Candidatus Palauibacter sp.]|uniref:hypothetical protein n=1 Tax=Candidatus Palauibacter sp. TaxID=3101350 RepID=UPI003B0167B6